MKIVKSLFQIDWAILAIAIGAIGLRLAPAPSWPLPNLTTDAVDAAPSAGESLDLTVLAAKFDIARLPAKAPKVAAPETVAVDPLASLRGFILVGVIVADEKPMALITNGSQRLALSQGDMLGDFQITTISPTDVSLENGHARTSLTLPN